jgi:hypothetical protein
MTHEYLESCMEEAKAIAVGGYKRVLGDSPESATEEQEDELTAMYTAGMFDKKGEPILARSWMTTEQAEALREKGGEGRLDELTATGVG